MSLRGHRFPHLAFLPTVLATLASHPLLIDAARVTACPATTVCDRSLGIALTPPTGWLRVKPPKVQRHTIVLVTRPTSGLEYNIRLHIAAWGTTRDRNGVHGANAGADRFIDGFRIRRHVSRVPVRYGGAPGVLVRGLPPTPGPTIEIILAHAGAVYLIIAPGSSLAPDRRAALASLRFIPRQGPFPSSSWDSRGRSCCPTPPRARSPDTARSVLRALHRMGV